MKNTVKTYMYYTAIAIIATIIELNCFIVGCFTSVWAPFFAWFAFEIIVAWCLCKEYYKDFRYVCPVCNQVFQPEFKEFLFAKHRLLERDVTCPKCHLKGMCDEIHKDDI